MSASTRPKSYGRMSQKKLNSLILKKPENTAPKPIPVERTRMKAKPILHSEVPYDQTQPVEKIRQFRADIQEMVRRYEADKEDLKKAELEMQDLLHYIEMGAQMNRTEGYKLFKRMAEVRKWRRGLKDEIDLLQPIYDYFHATNILDRLGQVQGDCQKMKQTIDAKSYLVSTDILDEFFESKEEEKTK